MLVPSAMGTDISFGITVNVRNTGSVTGTETVQVYIAYPTSSELTQVPFALKAFKKIKDIQPGEIRSVYLTLDKYAVSYWEERIGKWTIDAGEYTVLVGAASDNLPLKGSLVLRPSQTFEWNGL